MMRQCLASLAAVLLFSASPALAEEPAGPVFTASDLPYPFSAALQLGANTIDPSISACLGWQAGAKFRPFQSGGWS